MSRGQCIIYNHILVNRACSPSTSQKILAWSYFWNPSIINNTSSDHVATPAQSFEGSWFLKVDFVKYIKFFCSILFSAISQGCQNRLKTAYFTLYSEKCQRKLFWMLVAQFSAWKHEVICTTVRLLIIKSFWQPWHLERG